MSGWHQNPAILFPENTLQTVVVREHLLILDLGLTDTFQMFQEKEKCNSTLIFPLPHPFAFLHLCHLHDFMSLSLSTTASLPRLLITKIFAQSSYLT
jgi:hypothetical protein